MPASRDERIVTILRDAGSGEAAAAALDELVPIVYDELRALAGRRFWGASEALTLSPTELVHEAYLRLADASRVTAQGRAYFFASAAQAMRRIIVDHARRRRRSKRGGGVRAVTLHEAAALVDGADLDILDLETALERLADVAPRAARVVECRFYGGLSIEDTAVALGVTPRTVNRDWYFARAWLFEYLKVHAS